MAILVSSKTAEDDKNFWATSWEAYSDAVVLYGRDFSIDVAAEPMTAKCDEYYASPALYDALLDYRTREETRRQMRYAGPVCVGLDSIHLKWPEHWWINPPFDLKEKFIMKARQQQYAGRPGMMLLPYEPLTKWWRHHLKRDCIIYEPDGRYQFYERDGKTQKTGSNFGSVLVAFPNMVLHESVRIPYSRGLSSPRL